jgi:hypothetical protein
MGDFVVEKNHVLQKRPMHKHICRYVGRSLKVQEQTSVFRIGDPEASFSQQCLPLRVKFAPRCELGPQG